jgi:HEAT repeat protein
MSESFEELCTMLHSSNKEQCHNAIIRLCTTYPSQAAVLILNVVREKDEDTRSEARRWFHRRGGEKAAKALLPYLHDEELWVRGLVISMLRYLRDEQIVLPALFAYLQDRHWEGRWKAADMLGRWKDIQQVRERLVLCLQEDLDPLVRIKIRKVLGEPADPRELEPLVACLQHPDAHPFARSNAVFELGFIGDERALQPVLACLQDSNSSVRSSAVRALTRVGDRRILPMLLPVLQDTSWRVREDVVKILQRQEWRDKQVVEPLLACLECEENWLNRVEICKALGALEDQRARPLLLIICLSDEQEIVRREATKALARLSQE